MKVYITFVFYLLLFALECCFVLNIIVYLWSTNFIFRLHLCICHIHEKHKIDDLFTWFCIVYSLNNITSNLNSNRGY